MLRLQPLDSLFRPQGSGRLWGYWEAGARGGSAVLLVVIGAGEMGLEPRPFLFVP